MVLVIVVAASGPLFFGAMRLTTATGQRSQASNLAVQAIEQMRAVPYTEVGFTITPSGCTGSSPVVLGTGSALDGLPTSTVEGSTNFTLLRCVYWAASSMGGGPGAYKQTSVKVSWTTPAGILSVSQTSALYPGTYTTPTVPDLGTVPPPPLPGPTTTVPLPKPAPSAPACVSASPDSTNPTGAIVVKWSPATDGSASDSFIVNYTTYGPPAGDLTTSGNPYSTASQLGGTQWTATVGPNTTYYFQVEEVGLGGTSPASNTCWATTPPGGTSSTTCAANASATALTLALAGSSTPYSDTSPGSSATNDCTHPDQTISSQPTVAIPVADNFLSVTAATQIANAAKAGTSYACAGILSTGQSLGGGSSISGCNVSGGGSGGLSLNLAGLPGVGTAISGIVGGLSLNISSVTSWAGDGLNSSPPPSGSAALAGASCTVSTVGGLVSQTLPLALAATLTTPTNVLQACTNAIAASSNLTIKALASPLVTALTGSVLSITGAYQTTASGVLTESALHISVLNGTGTADLAKSTVGSNTQTTVVVPPPCAVTSLVVTPSVGTNNGGVSLTTSGQLVNETSFNLAVSANSSCTNVQVAYAPSDCDPGSSGCPTSFASLTPSGSTYYGTAGMASTVWSVGTTKFTVYVGTPAAAYTPIAQEQVILCTQKGNSGKC